MKSEEKRYKETFEIVKTTIINNDPAGLIDGGAPDDEYDNIINRLIVKLKDCESESDFKKLIEEEFSKVGTEIDKSNCNKVAQGLFREKKVFS